ncbi:hypothetical protein [Kitasatospora sp. NPDC093679]|uniref:hypothetical protein n=1 Tax=Kitasatospora sp. NPDC093679 TaxID=3154983 RepID=UPI00341E55B9
MKVLAVSAAGFLAGLGFVACGSQGEVGGANTGQSAPASSPRSVVSTPASAQASPVPTQSSPTGGGEGDVQLLSCTVTDDPFGTGYHSGNFVAVADLSVTNHSSKVSDYSITVEIVDRAGNRLDTTYSFVSRLAPGQSQNDGDEDAKGIKSIGEGAQPTCRILSVDRIASSV